MDKSYRVPHKKVEHTKVKFKCFAQIE